MRDRVENDDDDEKKIKKIEFVRKTAWTFWFCVIRVEFTWMDDALRLQFFG